jgi:hypothetical protein
MDTRPHVFSEVQAVLVLALRNKIAIRLVRRAVNAGKRQSSGKSVPPRCAIGNSVVETPSAAQQR